MKQEMIVEFDKETTQKLQGLAKQEKITVVKLLQRMIAVYSYLRKNTNDGKLKVAIIDKEGNVVKEISLD